ncbi:hypothetical protein T484DRAFT_1918684 [Baffinella frigidus]|nr:hypothetical protein T484DRAFT_1918684 [Cryptophyta sp. CCMP2293]
MYPQAAREGGCGVAGQWDAPVQRAKAHATPRLLALTAARAGGCGVAGQWGAPVQRAKAHVTLRLLARLLAHAKAHTPPHERCGASGACGRLSADEDRSANEISADKTSANTGVPPPANKRSTPAANEGETPPANEDERAPANEENKAPANERDARPEARLPGGSPRGSAFPPLGLCGIPGPDAQFWWRPEADGTRSLHIRGCILRRFGREEARACLRNQHLLFVGDSVTRYQYMSLASLLHRAPPEGSGNTPSNVCMPGLAWGSWKEFHIESSKSFEGRELCDCFRPEGAWDPSLERRTEENRFLFIPEANASVSFLQVFGGFPMHGHLPAPCRGLIGAPPCSLDALNRTTLAKARKVLTEAEYDANPFGEEDSFDWQGDVATVLENIVSRLDVDLLLLNSGLWGELTDEESVEEIFKAGDSAVAHTNGRKFWKRTTKRFRCAGGARRCHRDQWGPEAMGDSVPLAAAARHGWEVYDAAAATAPLEQDSFADGIHFRPYVYTQLNNLLLHSLCPTP